MRIGVVVRISRYFRTRGDDERCLGRPAFNLLAPDWLVASIVCCDGDSLSRCDVSKEARSCSRLAGWGIQLTVDQRTVP